MDDNHSEADEMPPESLWDGWAQHKLPEGVHGQLTQGLTMLSSAPACDLVHLLNPAWANQKPAAELTEENLQSLRADLHRQVISAPAVFTTGMYEPGTDGEVPLLTEEVASLASQPPQLLKGDDDDLRMAKKPEQRLAVTYERPCIHNAWERVTKKKNSITLRCKRCQTSWKTKLEFFQKCDAFYAGDCRLGDKCPNPHIYSKASERYNRLKALNVLSPLGKDPGQVPVPQIPIVPLV